MIYSSFFSYNIDIDLSFRAQNFNLWIEASFVFFFYKKNKYWRYSYAPERGGNMHVLRVSIVPFLLLKQFKYEVTLEFQQKQGCM
jgi:hypothetical protein